MDTKILRRRSSSWWSSEVCFADALLQTIARAHAEAFRRTQCGQQSADLTADLVHRRVSVGGREVRPSPKEYDIPQQFVIHAGRVLTHRHLLREAWCAEESADVQALRVFICQLPQKLAPTPIGLGIS